MNFGNRMSNVFFSFLGLAFSLIIFGAALGWTVPINMLLELFQKRDAGLAIAAVALLAALWAIYSLQLGFKKKPAARFTLVDTTSYGQIHITLEAIESFITRAAAPIKEVKEVKPRIKIIPEGMALLLKISVYPDTNVPNITKEIQEKVSEYLKEYGGMEVIEIEVVVDKIVHPVRSRVD